MSGPLRAAMLLFSWGGILGAVAAVAAADKRSVDALPPGNSPAATSPDKVPPAKTSPAKTSTDKTSPDKTSTTSPPKSVWDGGPRPLHEPLACLARYNITQFPVIAWCFHGAGQPYDASYVKSAQEAGFNVLIESQEMLKPAAMVGGVKIMAVAFRYDSKRIEAQTLDRFGADHPALMGFVLDDNCKHISKNSKSVATWMKENYPHLIPFVSANRDPRSQLQSNIRILGTQNSRMKGGGSAQADGYCGRMEMDRQTANMFQMSFWPLWYDKSSAGSIRFQLYAAIAYGAQGVVCFAYTPSLPPWSPNGPARKAHADAARYIHEVIGPYVLGTRCAEVLHSTGMGPQAHRMNRWVAKLDPELVVGMLYVENRLKGGRGAEVPDYLMVVHKRFTKGPEPPPRTVHVDLSPSIYAVEVLEPASSTATSSAARPLRRIEPGFHAAVDLLTGDGRLLIVDPDLAPVLGSLERPYRNLCDRAGQLAAQFRADTGAAATKGADSDRAKTADKAASGPNVRDASPTTADDLAKQAAALSTETGKLLEQAKDEQARDAIGRLKTALEHLPRPQPGA